MAKEPFGKSLTRQALGALVGDLRQLASVRSIVLNDGPERGVRALAFSTGGGLDFWVLVDRSFDIGPLWFCGIPMAWQSPSGFRAPALNDPDAEGGTGFQRSFSGLLVTCGLDHIRQSRHGKPLHGRLAFTPGRLLAYGEDWNRAAPVLYCEGEVHQASYGGEALKLTRRIEAPIGGTVIRIADRVHNLLAEPQPHELLYHFNLGYPAIGEGTEISLDQWLIAGPLSGPEQTHMPEIRCYAAGTGKPRCTVVTHLPSDEGTFRTTVQFDPASLPFFQVLQDLRPHRYLVAIEPCTSDRNDDGTSIDPGQLPANASCSYSVAIGFGF